MTCRRCFGLMVVEESCDSKVWDISGESRSARCLNCGNLEDAVIFVNRLKARSIGIDMELRSMKSANRRTMDRASGRHV